MAASEPPLRPTCGDRRRKTTLTSQPTEVLRGNADDEAGGGRVQPDVAIIRWSHATGLAVETPLLGLELACPPPVGELHVAIPSALGCTPVEQDAGSSSSREAGAVDPDMLGRDVAALSGPVAGVHGARLELAADSQRAGVTHPHGPWRLPHPQPGAYGQIRLPVRVTVVEGFGS